MSVLVIDINDAGIAVADATGLLAVEPGFAVVDGNRIVTGDEALGLSRLRPRQTSSRFWSAVLRSMSNPEATKTCSKP